MSLVSAVLMCVLAVAYADVYMHNPRLFDSQNNNRGGYNVGGPGGSQGANRPAMKYIAGSEMEIEWTNQHECGRENTFCDIILQYMCHEGLRDGTNTQTPSRRLDRDDKKQGKQEPASYYAACEGRKRNERLYTADQKLKGDSAIYTRQNPNGARRGLECPEERDYYPYWGPSPWKDIVIMTDDLSKCPQVRTESQNVKAKPYCAPKELRGSGQTPKDELAPLTQAECTAKGNDYEWKTDGFAAAHGIAAPPCIKVPPTRDNHLGNVPPSGTNSDTIPTTSRYIWKVPDDAGANCAVRIRYNITVGDYEAYGATGATVEHNQEAKQDESEDVNDVDSLDEINDDFDDKDANDDKLKDAKALIKDDNEDSKNDDIEENEEDEEVQDGSEMKDPAPASRRRRRRRRRRRTRQTRQTRRTNTPAAAPVPPKINVASDFGLSPTEAAQRNYRMQNNPKIKPLKMGNTIEGLEFQLAINTAQTGRVFEDRSHKISIVARDTSKIPADAVIHNLNVRGKRGNIVQVYPNVEYDFTPNTLKVKKGDYVHVQWNGALTNPQNNDGQGKAGTDKSNIVTVAPKVDGQPGNMGKGWPGNTRFTKIDDANSASRFMGVDATTARKLAVPFKEDKTALQQYYITPPAGPNTQGDAPLVEDATAKDASTKDVVTKDMFKELEHELQDIQTTLNDTLFSLRDAKSHHRWRRDTIQDQLAELDTIASKIHIKKETMDAKKDETKDIDANDDAKDNDDEDVVENDDDKDDEMDESEIKDATPASRRRRRRRRRRRGQSSSRQSTTRRTTAAAVDTGLGTRRTRQVQNELNDSPEYVDIGPIKANECGKWHYMCTRNNNFSNRSQKGKLEVAGAGCPIIASG